jgi:hypothetical protein
LILYEREQFITEAASEKALEREVKKNFTQRRKEETKERRGLNATSSWRAFVPALRLCVK